MFKLDFPFEKKATTRNENKTLTSVGSFDAFHPAGVLGFLGGKKTHLGVTYIYNKEQKNICAVQGFLQQ